MRKKHKNLFSPLWIVDESYILFSKTHDQFFQGLIVSHKFFQAFVTRPDHVTVLKDAAPPPPLVVMAMNLRTLPNPKSHQNEVWLDFLEAFNDLTLTYFFGMKLKQLLCQDFCFNIINNCPLEIMCDIFLNRKPKQFCYSNTYVNLASHDVSFFVLAPSGYRGFMFGT